MKSIQENSEIVSQSSDKVVPEHLKSIFENISKSLTGSQIEQIKDLLIAYQDIFMGPDGKLGRTGLVKLPHRRLSVKKEKEIVDNEIDKMLDDDIIEPSSGPWASPILLVKKKDGSIRFCIDYRKVNLVVMKNAYPLPRTDECLESLSGSKFMCPLDYASGYWQQEVDIKDRKKNCICIS